MPPWTNVVAVPGVVLPVRLFSVAACGRVPTIPPRRPHTSRRRMASTRSILPAAERLARVRRYRRFRDRQYGGRAQNPRIPEATKKRCEDQFAGHCSDLLLALSEALEHGAARLPAATGATISAGRGHHEVRRSCSRCVPLRRPLP
jgi:hypothetical protein